MGILFQNVGYSLWNTNSRGSNNGNYHLVCKTTQASAPAPAAAQAADIAPAPAPAPRMVTNTSQPIHAGAVTVPLNDITGIEVGDIITISNDTVSEERTVIAVAATESLLLSLAHQRSATGGTVTVSSAFTHDYSQNAA